MIVSYRTLLTAGNFVVACVTEERRKNILQLGKTHNIPLNGDLLLHKISPHQFILLTKS